MDIAVARRERMKMSACNRRGFTMLELIMVVAIIAILVALLMPVLGSVQRRAKETATRTFIKSIETAIAAYEFDWGLYPPDGLAAPITAFKAGNPPGGTYTVSNSSALYYYLTSPFRVLPNGVKGEVWATKDAGPYLQVPEQNQQTAGGGPAINIADVYGRPFQYDNIRDPQPSVNGYDAVPLEIRNTATFFANPGANGRNLQSFDLFSAGPGTGTQITKPIGNFKCLTD
jgi:prepilin-type N-terminal cleavage/methylation domain-containing protein